MTLRKKDDTIITKGVITVALRIREARERLGITQKLLADKLKIKQTTFNGYETGAHDPKSETLVKIAEYCGTTVDFLVGLSDNPEKSDGENGVLSVKEREHIETYRRLDAHGKEIVDIVMQKEAQRIGSEKRAEIIPMYRFPFYDIPASAGTGEPLDISDAETAALSVKPPRGTDYILRISGDSMEPDYKSGDYVYVKKTEELEYDETGIFFDDGNVYMKKYTSEGLLSLNTKYKIIEKNDNIRCLGKVIGKVKGKVEIDG